MISMYIKNPMTQDSAASTPESTTAPKKAGKRIQVRKSGVHGKGVFSTVKLKKGEVLIEYIGEVISWKEALRRHPHDPKDPDHTFYFHVDDKHVIDAKYGGNAARWINHACTPNCEADEIDGRIFIKALRAIPPDTELFYDYGLIIDEPYTKKLKKQFECRCGTKGCRGTMLAPKKRG
ncbi:Methyltransferase OS=Rhizobacter sp. Root404 OX=1736528 GN=ASC76_12905 PE=4 SV=1 [Rhizobacter fulvus]